MPAGDHAPAAYWMLALSQPEKDCSFKVAEYSEGAVKVHLARTKPS